MYITNLSYRRPTIIIMGTFFNHWDGIHAMENFRKRRPNKVLFVQKFLPNTVISEIY